MSSPEGLVLRFGSRQMDCCNLSAEEVIVGLEGVIVGLEVAHMLVVDRLVVGKLVVGQLAVDMKVDKLAAGT